MAESTIDKKKYKLLKQAFREERELRMNIENELQNQITKVEEIAKENEILKDRNIELYDQKEKFEEKAALNKSISRATNEGENYTDEEHIKEMLGT